MTSRSATRKPALLSQTPAPLHEVRGRKANLATTSGRLVGIGPGHEPWVDVPSEGLVNVAGRSTVPVSPALIGREVLITFLGKSPVVVGVLREASDDDETARAPRLDAVVDGERIVLSGQKEVVLRCGKASIALTADGTVVIKGARLLSSAAGSHRIKGGSVQIN
jgi:hypothetical protein